MSNTEFQQISMSLTTSQSGSSNEWQRLTKIPTFIYHRKESHSNNALTKTKSPVNQNFIPNSRRPPKIVSSRIPRASNTTMRTDSQHTESGLVHPVVRNHCYKRVRIREPTEVLVIKSVSKEPTDTSSNNLSPFLKYSEIYDQQLRNYVKGTQELTKENCCCSKDSKSDYLANAKSCSTFDDSLSCSTISNYSKSIVTTDSEQFEEKIKNLMGSLDNTKTVRFDRRPPTRSEVIASRVSRIALMLDKSNASSVSRIQTDFKVKSNNSSDYRIHHKLTRKVSKIPIPRYEHSKSSNAGDMSVHNSKTSFKKNEIRVRDLEKPKNDTQNKSPLTHSNKSIPSDPKIILNSKIVLDKEDTKRGHTLFDQVVFRDRSFTSPISKVGTEGYQRKSKLFCDHALKPPIVCPIPSYFNDMRQMMSTSVNDIKKKVQHQNGLLNNAIKEGGAYKNLSRALMQSINKLKTLMHRRKKKKRTTSTPNTATRKVCHSARVDFLVKTLQQSIQIIRKFTKSLEGVESLSEPPWENLLLNHNLEKMETTLSFEEKVEIHKKKILVKLNSYTVEINCAVIVTIFTKSVNDLKEIIGDTYREINHKQRLITTIFVSHQFVTNYLNNSGPESMPPNTFQNLSRIINELKRLVVNGKINIENDVLDFFYHLKEHKKLDINMKQTVPLSSYLELSKKLKRTFNHNWDTFLTTLSKRSRSECVKKLLKSLKHPRSIEEKQFASTVKSIIGRLFSAPQMNGAASRKTNLRKDILQRSVRPSFLTLFPTFPLAKMIEREWWNVYSQLIPYRNNSNNIGRLTLQLYAESLKNRSPIAPKAFPLLNFNELFRKRIEKLQQRLLGFPYSHTVLRNRCPAESAGGDVLGLRQKCDEIDTKKSADYFLDVKKKRNRWRGTLLSKSTPAFRVTDLLVTKMWCPFNNVNIKDVIKSAID